MPCKLESDRHSGCKNFHKYLRALNVRTTIQSESQVFDARRPISEALTMVSLVRDKVDGPVI